MLIISTQNFELNLGCWCIMQQAILMMVQLILWTKPFCCDVYGIKFWCTIPWVLIKSPNSHKQCSPLLLILNILTFFLIYVSTRLLNFWHFGKHSLLREKLTKMFKKSSMKITKYLAPLENNVWICHQISEWTSPNTSCPLYVCWKWFFVLFAKCATFTKCHIKTRSHLEFLLQAFVQTTSHFHYQNDLIFGAKG